MTTHKMQKSNAVKIIELEERIKQLESTLNTMTALVRGIPTGVMQITGKLTDELRQLNQAVQDVHFFQESLRDVLGVDKEVLSKVATEKKIAVYNQALEATEAAEHLEPVSTVDEDTIVLITSKTPDLPEDKGILRSNFHMSEIKLEALKKGLLGRSVGDSLDVEIDGTRHEVTLLSAKKRRHNEPAQAQNG